MLCDIVEIFYLNQLCIWRILSVLSAIVYLGTLEVYGVIPEIFFSNLLQFWCILSVYLMLFLRKERGCYPRKMLESLTHFGICYRLFTSLCWKFWSSGCHPLNLIIFQTFWCYLWLFTIICFGKSFVVKPGYFLQSFMHFNEFHQSFAFIFFKLISWIPNPLWIRHCVSYLTLSSMFRWRERRGGGRIVALHVMHRLPFGCDHRVKVSVLVELVLWCSI